MKGKINRRNFLKLTGKGALIWAASGIIAPNTLWASSLPKEVLIGAILPLTGGLATTGDEIKSGMELAVSKINGKSKYFLNYFVKKSNQIANNLR